ncbi:MAG TPA: DMT family transporter [Burkholderiaceae bacterium]
MTPLDTRHARLDGSAVALIVACCALWGLNQVVVKATIPYVAPLAQGALRSAFAALLVWLFMRRRAIAAFERRDEALAGLAAGLLFGLEFCFINYGLHFTSASRMVVFVYLAPFVVALGMPFISRSERLERGQVLGLVLAFGSVAYAFQEGFGASSSTQWVGDALAIAAGVAWGATTLLIRATALSAAAPERTLFYQLAVSAPLMWLAAFVAGESVPQFAAAAAASIAFQAVLVAFASYLAWFWLLRHYPATRVSAFTFLTPVSGLVFGALILGEPITPRIVIAVAGIAVGIRLVNRPQARRP